MQHVQEKLREADSLLPDFCSAEAVITVLVFAQMMALLLMLAGRLGDAQMWQRLLLLSLYLHWIGLSCAAVLCQVRRWHAGISGASVLILSYCLLIAVSLMVGEAAWQVAQWRGLQAFLPDEVHAAFLTRNLCISAVVAALALRYFWLQQQNRRQAQAEIEARYQALQARINPHYLFNSLNSIASLVATRPKEAETAVEDLAQMFRAGLKGADRQVSLGEELEVTRAYLRTEQLRLGDRLRIRWDIAPGLEQLRVPSLCVQPLVENAVNHGIAPRAEGGEVAVDIRRSGIHLLVEVRNPLPPLPGASPGAGVALDNIRQRLKLMYGETAALVTELGTDCFTARLLLPSVE